MRRVEKGIITCAVTGSIHTPTIPPEARLAILVPGCIDIACDDAILVCTRPSTWGRVSHMTAPFDTDGNDLAEPLYYGNRTRVEVLAPEGVEPRANARDIETMTMTAVEA